MVSITRGMLALSLPILAVHPAAGSTGGPELAEALGWDGSSGAVYFAIHHCDESGRAPTIVRLPAQGAVRSFEVQAWSKEGDPSDSTYRARMRQLQKRLRPLKETLSTSVAQRHEVAQLDSLKNFSGTWGRFRVHVSWFDGLCEGTVEAITYRDPSLRMIHLYEVPGRNERIGVFSYTGLPYEVGYEVQWPGRQGRPTPALPIVGGPVMLPTAAVPRPSPAPSDRRS
jgi:hypothetical protein